MKTLAIGPLTVSQIEEGKPAYAIRRDADGKLLGMAEKDYGPWWIFYRYLAENVRDHIGAGKGLEASTRRFFWAELR